MFLSNQQQSDYDIEQQQFLVLRQNILPANQIITKKYESDNIPLLKLISIQERQQFMASIDKNTQEDSTKCSYKVDFSDEQSLGYYYSKKIKNNLLYVKFDNCNFYRSPQNKSKYLAGFFVPFNQLTKPQVKQHKNLYKGIKQTQQFSYLEYQDRIDQSFKQNCISIEGEPKFSSNYQSSNLFMVLKNELNDYDLILQNDINSKGTTQWFNFAMRFSQIGIYKLNIVNLIKSHSLFQKGMKIPLFSYQNNQTHNRGWIRGCQNISYEKNSINRQGNSDNCYYTLHFQYNNEHKDDTVIFSYGYPYTGVDLEKFFSKITQRKLSNNLIIDRTQISETLSGLPVYAYRIYPKKTMLSLSNLHRSPMNTLQGKNPNQKSLIQQPKGIVLMARQHPGQSQSSFILQGVIQFLLQNNEYDNTKRSFHYYILPMVNIDGVFYGNYRTNLSGNDLNRIWKQPRKDFHPQIYSIKKYLYNANRITQLKLIIDIHGHSSALNSFFYGNPLKKQGILQLQGQNPKLFPYFCSKQVKQISFLQSTFSVSEDKKNSARVVLNQMFPKASVYTLENSFFGYKKGNKIVEFTIQKYKKLGRNLIRSYLEYSKITERIPLIKQKWEKEIQSIQASLKNSTLFVGGEDSDSEASQQLIELQNEFQSIDRINIIPEGLNQNHGDESEKKMLFAQKYPNIHQRLYERKKFKYISSECAEEQKKPPFRGVHLHDTSKNMALSLTQLGFLSIVKIQTKQSLNEKRGQFSNQKTPHHFSNQKSFQSSETKQNQKQQPEQNVDQSRPTHIIPKTQNFFKKEFTVRSVKQQNSLLQQKAQIKYLNQKQFLMKRRRSLNRSNKFKSTQCSDSIIYSVQKKSITHSRSTNALLNIIQHKKQDELLGQCDS